MKQPGDQATRAQLLEALDDSFVVEAAAGTGKTTVLVGRIVKTVRSGRARLGQLIAVTFTEKAAGEMKLRLRARLEQERQGAAGEELARLVTALEELEVARIGTIHGLCADLLREYPVEAEVDPLFEVLSEGDAEALLQGVFERQYQALLADPPEGVRRVLRRSAEAAPRRALFEAVRALVEHRDFAAPWRREPFELGPEVNRVLPHLEALAARASQVSLKPDRDGSKLLDAIREAARFMEDLRHREAVAPRDAEGLEAQLRELADPYLWKGQAWDCAFSRGATEAQVLAERDAAWQALQAFTRRADADLAACLHRELQPVVEAWAQEKACLGVLDFVDLLLALRDLLVRHEAVRRSLQARFTRLFVDEFQDTDPLQSEIVLLLAAEDAAVSEPFATRPAPGKLFVVGDPKQSIYRFRRADVLLYERVKQHLLAHGARLAYLSTSFRSTPGLQAAVNGAFELAMAPGGHQATYVPLGEWREARREQPSLVVLPAPAPFTQGRRPFVSRDAVERGVPDAVGAFVEWLVTKSGWTVEEEGHRVPVQPRHVCILFKRLRKWGGVDLPRPYAEALEARGVPHVLVGGRSFHAREEVAALRTALLAVERPEDELSVYATLRGPFFGFTDEALLVFRHEVGRLHPLRPFEAEALPPGHEDVLAALAGLRRLHLERNRRAAAATVHAFLELTRAHAGVALWTAGDQALANVLQLADVARAVERRASSFRDVVEALQAAADAGEAPEAPLVEEGTGGVRLMTVHAAKGLEFPVVILAEPTASATRAEPSHWVDPAQGLWAHALAGCAPAELLAHEAEVRARDAEEAVRLTYVAATRARELLVVPLCSEKRLEGTWTAPLYPSLYPAQESLQQPRPAPGAPAFGDDPLPERIGGVPAHAPRPGLHRAESRRNGVVWWDVKTLGLAREARPGLEAPALLEDDAAAGAESLQAWQAWQAARAAGLARGAAPSLTVVTARELPPVETPGQVPVEETSAPRAGRPTGPRFGALVHAALAVVPLDAAPAQVDAAVAVQARALGAPEEERATAAAAVLAALAHPLVAGARTALEVRREAALVDHLDDGTVVEGVVDLAWRDGEGWWVVEFKTDEALEPHRAAYEAQVQCYVRAIARATGGPARGVLLRV